ncbi:MAG: IclR family transcriptional regulator [Proteobacteria bacterium]|jgi:DNA-binding IclR family transcriptional regulator|nr:MAG: IclR family transcriptional regulator [Pseudomonadota bacterium]
MEGRAMTESTETNLQTPAGEEERDQAARRASASNDTVHLGAMGKAFAILEAIANAKQPLTMTDLVRTCGLTKPTAHRITTMLAEMGYLAREPLKRGLIEGPRLISLALSTLATAAPRSRRHAILRSVSEKTGETCNFGVLVGSEVVYLDRVEAKWPLALRFEAGSRVPAHCTAIGKLLLALLPAHERAAAIASMPLTRLTTRTITDPVKLNEALERINRTRIGIDDEEFIEGVVCVSVPVIAKSGQVVGGIAVSAPAARISIQEALSFVPIMHDAAQRLSATYSDSRAAS